MKVIIMNAYQTRLKIQMNVRYHDVRLGFLTSLANFERFLILASYTATIFRVKEVGPDWLVLGTLGGATFFTILLFATSLEHSRHAHFDSLRRWKQLKVSLEKIDAQNEQQLADLNVAIAEAEVEDPPLNRALLVRAQNEILGQSDADWRVKQSPIHRSFAQIFDLDKETQFERVGVSKLWPAATRV
jgi:hypothetical protein